MRACGMNMAKKKIKKKYANHAQPIKIKGFEKLKKKSILLAFIFFYSDWVFFVILFLFYFPPPTHGLVRNLPRTR